MYDSKIYFWIFHTWRLLFCITLPKEKSWISYQKFIFVYFLGLSKVIIAYCFIKLPFVTLYKKLFLLAFVYDLKVHECRFENLLTSSCENIMLKISYSNTFYFLKYGHVRYVKSLYTNIQKQ